MTQRIHKTTQYATPQQFVASGLVLGRGRTVLLVHHRKLKSWVYPGGHVKWFETPDKAVRREVFEETDIRVRLLGTRYPLALKHDELLNSPYLMLSEKIAFKPEPVHHHVDLVYLCGVTPSDRHKSPKPNRAEVLAARFVGRSEMHKLRMLPDVRRLLEYLFSDDAAWKLLPGNPCY